MMLDTGGDPVDRYASIPFTGTLRVAPGRAEEQMGFWRIYGWWTPAPFIVIGLLLWLLLMGKPNGSSSDEHGTAEPPKRGQIAVSFESPNAVAEVIPPPKEPDDVEVRSPEGPERDVEPMKTAPKVTGVNRGSDRRGDALIVREEDQPKPILKGDQLPGRQPAHLGVTGGEGRGGSGPAPRSPGGGVGSMLPGGGEAEGGDASRVSDGEQPRSGGMTATGRLGAADVWAAARAARAAGGSGSADADVIARASKHIREHWPAGVLHAGGWTVAATSGDVCAVLDADRSTVVCARHSRDGGFQARVGGPEAGQYGRTDTALRHVARLLGWTG